MRRIRELRLLTAILTGFTLVCLAAGCADDGEELKTYLATDHFCPSELTPNGILDHTIRLVETMPTGFDTDRARRDEYLTKLVNGLTAVGLTVRAEALAESISSPPDRALALGRIAIKLAADKGNETAAQALVTHAVQTISKRTRMERRDTYQKLLTMFRRADYTHGVRIVDPKYMDMEVALTGPDDKSYSPYVRTLTKGAVEMARLGFFDEANRRIEEAKAAANKIVSEPSKRAAVLTRTALLRLELEGLSAVIAAAHDIRRPSERALALARIGEALQKDGDHENVQSMLMSIRDTVRESHEMIWDRSNNDLVLVQVARLQASLGDRPGARETLETIWKSVTSLPLDDWGRDNFSMELSVWAAFAKLEGAEKLITNKGESETGDYAPFDTALERIVSRFSKGAICDPATDLSYRSKTCTKALGTLLVTLTKTQSVERAEQLMSRLGIRNGKHKTEYNLQRLLNEVAVDLARTHPLRARALWNRLHPAPAHYSLPTEVIVEEVRSGRPVPQELFTRKLASPEFFETTDTILEILRSADREREALVLLDAAEARAAKLIWRSERLHALFTLMTHQFALGRWESVVTAWKDVLVTSSWSNESGSQMLSRVSTEDTTSALKRTGYTVPLVETSENPSPYSWDAPFSELLHVLSQYPSEYPGSVHERLLETAKLWDLKVLGEYYIRQGKLNRAVDVLDILKIELRDDLLTAMAIAKVLAGDVDGAFADWERVSTHRSFGDRRVKFVDALIRAGNFAKAQRLVSEIKNLEERLKVNADLVVVAYETDQEANTQALLDSVHRLADEYRRAPEAAEQLIALAERLQKLGDTKETQRLLTRALALIYSDNAWDYDANFLTHDSIASAEARVLVYAKQYSRARRKAQSIVRRFTRNQALSFLAKFEANNDLPQLAELNTQVNVESNSCISQLLELANSAYTEGHPTEAREHLDQAMLVALASHCDKETVRVLLEFARMGRGHEAIVWMSYLKAERRVWLHFLAATAISRYEAGDRTGAAQTLGWTVDVLKGRTPQIRNQSGVESAVRLLAASAAQIKVADAHRCPSFEGLRYAGQGEFTSLLTLAEIAAMLGDVRVGPFLDTAPTPATWRNESTDRQTLLSKFAVGEVRAGRLRRACGYLEHILSENARVKAVIDVALTAQVTSITEEGRVR